MTAAWGMLDSGAAIVDVGGESTRPGSVGVTADEELERIEQVLLDLGGAPVSVDTSKAEVARRALELGVELVNDVTALRGDPELAGVVADAGCYLCLMHMQGEPRTMQLDPTYDDVVSDVKRFLEERLAFAVAAGIREELVCLDPGIGFGKTVAHNLELVRRLGELAALGRPLLLGLSRKSSLGKLTGDPDAKVGSSRRRSAARSALSIAAPPSARARRAGARSSARRRERGGRVIVELSGLEVFGYHGVEEEEQSWGSCFCSTCSWRWETAARVTGWGTRSTTPGRKRDPRAFGGQRFDLLEALATRMAACCSSVSRRGRCASACASPVEPAGMTVEYSAVTIELP